jgi:hypothetical protein
MIGGSKIKVLMLWMENDWKEISGSKIKRFTWLEKYHRQKVIETSV